ncbi:DUF1453 domain-containing protein [Streptomyces sp. NPDC007088]|uniref:DUF1453 domain-containing protein n=1 Tax=Streptomyces sp. NPDC007088 TaxID=3364773 RepID=UPI0036869033
MSGLSAILLVGVAVVLVAARLVRAQPVGGGRSRWWIVPVVLAFLALREPGLVDSSHESASLALLAVEVVVGLAIGAGWAWTSRVWADEDGTVWAKGTRASAGIWGGGILVRAALFGVGTALGLHQDSSTLLLALAVTLLARGAVLSRRAALLGPAYGDPAAEAAPAAWRDRV